MSSFWKVPFFKTVRISIETEKKAKQTNFSQFLPFRASNCFSQKTSSKGTWENRSSIFSPKENNFVTLVIPEKNGKLKLFWKVPFFKTVRISIETGKKTKQTNFWQLLPFRASNYFFQKSSSEGTWKNTWSIFSPKEKIFFTLVTSEKNGKLGLFWKVPFFKTVRISIENGK